MVYSPFKKKKQLKWQQALPTFYLHVGGNIYPSLHLEWMVVAAITTCTTSRLLHGWWALNRWKSHSKDISTSSLENQFSHVKHCIWKFSSIYYMPEEFIHTCLIPPILQIYDFSKPITADIQSCGFLWRQKWVWIQCSKCNVFLLHTGSLTTDFHSSRSDLLWEVKVFISSLPWGLKLVRLVKK